jgi:hypothetical protein
MEIFSQHHFTATRCSREWLVASSNMMKFPEGQMSSIMMEMMAKMMPMMMPDGMTREMHEKMMAQFTMKMTPLT